MKKVFVLGLIIVFAVCASGFAIADNANMLKANEKKAWENACTVFPAEHRLNVQQFKELYDRVMAGQEDAYLVDLRTHPEFYAAHIPGTEHIHAGHMYTFPKKIKNKDAKIVLWCRTYKRGAYVGERLAQYGYTNLWWYKDGIVGWIKTGYPLCNQFMGLFKVTEYHKNFSGKYKEGLKKGQEKDPYRIREFYPY